MADPVRIVLMPGVQMPSRGSEHASGLDLCALSRGVVPARGVAVFDTGVSLSLPPGFEGQIRPRSGLFMRYGVIGILGTIDADYRGWIRVGLHNTSSEPYEVVRGDRIAQLVIAPVWLGTPVEVEVLDQTARGSGGFGSTGR